MAWQAKENTPHHTTMTRTTVDNKAKKIAVAREEEKVERSVTFCRSCEVWVSRGAFFSIYLDTDQYRLL